MPSSGAIAPVCIRQAFGLLVLALVLAGCSSVKVRKPFVRNCLRQHHEADVAAAPAACADPLAGALLHYDTACGGHHQAGPAVAVRYRDAALEAFQVLQQTADPATRDRALRLHNQAVEQLVRAVKRQAGKEGKPWQQVCADLGITLTAASNYVDPHRFTDIECAADFMVKGIDEEFANCGVGVPLVLYRENDRDHPADPQDRFYPKHFKVAATVVLQPAPGADGAGLSTLRFYDTYEQQQLELGHQPIQLAADRTTSLAIQVEESVAQSLARMGVFRPQVDPEFVGIYMLRPYQPGKIPVVLVHGLNSTPVTWVQTLNRLQNDPALSAHYQFWMFFYPTGAPLTASAERLRTALDDVVHTFDPTEADPALQQMVLVGHSMGGLISKMMIQDSGTTVWDAIFTRPYEELRASDSTRSLLAEQLFFQPVAGVRRVVFIATPHQGSRVANRLPGRLVTLFIRPSDLLRDTFRELRAENGRNVLTRGMRIGQLTGVDELRPNDPVLKAVNQLPMDPTVPYHSIIPQIGFEQCHLPTDGIVPYWSSHLDGANSEEIISGTHRSHDKASATEEIKRILREHWAQQSQAPACTPTPVP